MPYNFAAESFHTKKLCSRLSSRKSPIFCTENEKIVVFEAPFGGLGVTYAVHLRLIAKLVGDFLLVIIELFSLGAFVLSQFTRLTDRWTDGRTDRRSSERPRCIQCSAVKTVLSLYANSCASCLPTVIHESIIIVNTLLVVQRDPRLLMAMCLYTITTILDQTRSLAIAKRPCDCCIILKSGSYTKAISTDRPISIKSRS